LTSKKEHFYIQRIAELEEQVAARTAQLQEKVQKLNESQRAMLYMVEDLNQITAELKEERRKLELFNQELEAFSYSVSHDLRAPLRAINGYSQFLTEDYANKLDEEGKRFIRIIQQSTARMDQLISDLLNLSRLSRAEMNHTMIDTRALAQSIYDETATEQEKEVPGQEEESVEEEIKLSPEEERRTDITKTLSSIYPFINFKFCCK